MIKRVYLLAACSVVSMLAVSGQASAQVDETTFQLVPVGTILSCLADPSSTEPPVARVTVVRGKLNDHLTLHAEHIKPGLQFDLFTVQNSPFLADGSKDPKFKNFGLAWYQTDVEANQHGTADVSIRTILLDQIFGFDPVVGLAPTNTFHVGFWFNNPQDAVACGFDPKKPTPFNGEHKAGPLAMVSLPAAGGPGPLCTSPDTSHQGACNH